MWLLALLCFFPLNLLRKRTKALVQNTENLKDIDRFLFLLIRFFLPRYKCFCYQQLHRLLPCLSWLCDMKVAHQHGAFLFWVCSLRNTWKPRPCVFPGLCTQHTQLPPMEQGVPGDLPQGNQRCTSGDILDGTAQTGFQMDFLGFLWAASSTLNCGNMA